MVAAIMDGVPFAFEMGQCAGNERHTGDTNDGFEPQPLSAPRLGEPRRQSAEAREITAPAACDRAMRPTLSRTLAVACGG
jgi:hypothetical protein